MVKKTVFLSVGLSFAIVTVFILLQWDWTFDKIKTKRNSILSWYFFYFLQLQTCLWINCITKQILSTEKNTVQWYHSRSLDNMIITRATSWENASLSVERCRSRHIAYKTLGFKNEIVHTRFICSYLNLKYMIG